MEALNAMPRALLDVEDTGMRNSLKIHGPYARRSKVKVAKSYQHTFVSKLTFHADSIH
jgi:hypothetical protein